MIAEGEATTALETVFAESLHLPHAIAVGSGSQALLLTLMALDLQPGHAVILPDYTCVEILAVLHHLRLQPIIVDVQEDYLLSVEATSAAMQGSIKAIIFPYSMGIYRDISPLRDFEVPVIEDCAVYVNVESFRMNAIAGDIAIFSFSGTKLLTAGEGGMIVTRDDDMAARIRSQKKFLSTKFKVNLYPLSDLQAALALCQLRHLPEFLARRATIAERYALAFSSISGLSLPRVRSLFFRFPIQLPSAQAVDQAIRDFLLHDIIARRPVTPLLSTFEATEYPAPCAADLHARTLSIPLYPALMDEEVDIIVSVAQHILAECAEFPVRTEA